MKTPKSEAARVAQATAGAQIYAETVSLIKELAKNPIAELVIGIALIERLESNGIFGSPLANTLKLGVGTIITAQQLAPLVPYAADAFSSLIKAVAPAGAAAIAG